MLTAYFVVAVAGTWINFLELHLTGFGYYDLSINQQALSSTINSNHPYPFYEAINCGRDGRCSFLLVHPVFLAYGMTVPYAIWPTPLTLFAIQDLVLALAALPLYAIAQIATNSQRLSLAIAGVYLVWLPAFTGIFSFHWEAFIPLEFFLIFWLWLTERYRYAIPVVIIAYITLEVMPILLLFLAVFFLLPWVRPLARLLRRELPRFGHGHVPFTAPARAIVAQIRTGLRSRRRLRVSAYLLLGSLAAYLLLHGFVTNGGVLLGLPTLPAKYVIPVTRPVYAAQFTLGNLLKAGRAKLVFWLVIFGTLGMVPLLAPRTLVLIAPWIGLSVCATSGYYRMGDQYAFITASLIFIGFIYGAARLKRWSETVPSGVKKEEPPTPGTERLYRRTRRLLEELQELGAGTGSATPAPGAPSAASVDRWWRRRRRVARASLTVILVGVVAFNLFLNPLNPLAAPLKNDRPFVSQSALGFSGPLNTTGYERLERVVSIIPKGDIVAVSPMLFPFVANNPYAYPLLSRLDYPLPFNTAATQYVLLLVRGGSNFPPVYVAVTPNGTVSLRQAIYNPTYFGVRAWIPTTPIGGVLLFQRGFNGTTEVLGSPPPPFLEGNFTAVNGLVPDRAGHVAPNSTSQAGWVIETTRGPSTPAMTELGPVFSGPGVTLLQGTYEVNVALRGWVNGTDTDPDAPVVTLAYSGFQVRLNATYLYAPALNSTTWTTFTFNFTVTYPIFDFSVAGSVRHPWYTFQVGYVSIVRVDEP